jgi:hypothetical protein
MGRRATRRRTRGFIDQANESQHPRRLRRSVIDDIDPAVELDGPVRA